MTVHISLLRGINVSGQKKIPMAELRALYGRLGLDRVTSYIQSGNVIFCSAQGSETKLAADLEKAIAGDFGFSVTVIIRSLDSWRNIARRHPLAEGADPARLHVTCLARRPPAAAVRALESLDTGDDRFSFKDRELYLHCPGGYARSRLSNTTIEKKLGVAATTRNWRTVGRLLELAQEAAA